MTESGGDLLIFSAPGGLKLGSRTTVSGSSSSLGRVSGRARPKPTRLRSGPLCDRTGKGHGARFDGIHDGRLGRLRRADRINVRSDDGEAMGWCGLRSCARFARL